MTKKRNSEITKPVGRASMEKAKKVWTNSSKDIDEYERLDYCQAWTYQTRGYSFLISYNTIVAFVDDSGNLYDVLRLVYGYTSTSAKHISKFRNKFRHVSEHTWRQV